MINVRTYIPNDYLLITRRRFDAITFLNFPNPRAMANTFARGEAYTMEVDGELVACGGVLPLWKGVGEVWLVASPLVERHKTAVGLAVVRKLKEMKKKYERLQTVIDREFVLSREWAVWMGFRSEGVMKKYIDGRDYIRYAMVKEEG